MSLRATPSGQVRRTQPVHAVTGPWSEQLQGSTTHPHPRHTLTPGGRSPGQAWARVGPAAGPGLGWHLSGEGRGLCVLAVVSLATWCVFVILVPPPPPPPWLAGDTEAWVLPTRPHACGPRGTFRMAAHPGRSEVDRVDLGPAWHLVGPREQDSAPSKQTHVAEPAGPGADQPPTRMSPGKVPDTHSVAPSPTQSLVSPPQRAVWALQ